MACDRPAVVGEEGSIGFDYDADRPAKNAQHAVHPFGFAEQGNIGKLGSDALQAQQGSVPDAVERVLPEPNIWRRMFHLRRFGRSVLHARNNCTVTNVMCL